MAISLGMRIPDALRRCVAEIVTFVQRLVSMRLIYRRSSPLPPRPAGRRACVSARSMAW